MTVLRRIDPLSAAKILGVVYAGFGLLVGLFLSVLALAGAALPNADRDDLLLPVFGVGAIVALPILYGLIGFVSGFLISVLYNVAARAVGGIRFELQPE